MDCIRIINLKIPGRHGVYDFEKEKDGLFELDADLFLDLKSAGNSDDLSETVNYDEAIGIITDVFNAKDRRLIESVAEDISSALSILKFSPKEASKRLEKLLVSAISNWQSKNENANLDSAQLFVKEIRVDSGSMLKRIRTAPQGRAHRIRKRSNHVTLVLSSKTIT